MLGRYFILGTDTDCGKTHATCKLVLAARAEQQKVMALKPVASGCHLEHGVLVSPDVLRLQQALSDQTTELCPWRFSAPISPHLAAASQGEVLSIDAIADFCMSDKWDAFDVVFIEGAGGLMVPLNGLATWVDLLKQTGLPVILVVGLRLGCINHALLTHAVLKLHAIECVGWIANTLEPTMLAQADNIKTLQAALDIPLLEVLPHETYN